MPAVLLIFIGSLFFSVSPANRCLKQPVLQLFVLPPVHLPSGPLSCSFAKSRNQKNTGKRVKPMKRNWRAGLLLLAIVTLTGCSTTRILERIGLVVAAGYETGTDGNLKASTVVQQVEPGSQTEVQVITSTAATSKGLRENENRKSGKKTAGRAASCCSVQ